MGSLKAWTEDGSPFIIAEVGQNHQGSLEKAREYIRILAFEGASAVKFQTRNNRYLFSADAYDAPYHSENAFAETYGAHRECLELKPEWLETLRDDCIKHNVKFMSTPFDEPSLELLARLDVDLLKIASFDLGNLPFIDRIGRLDKPTVLSIGGGRAEAIEASVAALRQHHDDLAVLHCVSEYPCEYHRLGLDNVEALKAAFPDLTIGLSDHFNGILSGPVAYLKGARVFEKHVTLNRGWRGTDHSFALEPEGFRKFVRDIRRVGQMLTPKTDYLGEEPVFKKLGKSLVAINDLPAGQPLKLEHLTGRIFRETHIPVRESHQVLGRRLLQPIKAGEPIMWNALEP
jgi:N-acetylneuraminate synthase/sialic acid synthase